MHCEQNVCPICGNKSNHFLIEDANLNFLSYLSKNNKIDAVISMTRIIWENIPQLRLTADQKTIVDELSKALLEDFQKKADSMLTTIRNLIKTFSNVAKELPIDIKGDFQNTMALFERELEALKKSSPTFENVVKAIEVVSKNIEETTQKSLSSVEKELSTKFKDALDKMGFPEPEQLKLLAHLIPTVIPLLEGLLRLQEVPSEKGKLGELELVRQLADFYPQDEIEHLGKSGDTDILAMPRFNGTKIGQILVESKKNNSGWQRSFLQQVRRHMQLRGERFAILAVEVMPKSANGFIVEYCPEGVILVTDRRHFQVSYGALRSALIALHPFRRKEIDFHKLFKDKKINEAVEEAYNYCEWVKKIRQRAKRIENNAKGVAEDVNQLDDWLKQRLRELQFRINDAVRQIATMETEDVLKD